ncbi:hypothetical protein PCE1_000896 [Barthelona sp. PCE]
MDISLNAIANFFGTISLILFMIAYFFPIRLSYKLKATDLSLPFVIFWIIGDTLALLGLFITGTFVTSQLLIHIFFVVMNFVLLTQYHLYKKKSDAEQLENDEFELKLPSMMPAFIMLIGVGFTQVRAAEGSLFGIEINTYATVLPWVSTLMYFSSRVSQVYKNYQDKSCESLSIGMFMCTFTGNVVYCVQVIISVYDHNGTTFGRQLPYMMSTGFIAMLDLVVLYQFKLYKPTDIAVNEDRKTGTPSLEVLVDDVHNASPRLSSSVDEDIDIVQYCLDLLAVDEHDSHEVDIPHIKSLIEEHTLNPFDRLKGVQKEDLELAIVSTVYYLYTCSVEETTFEEIISEVLERVEKLESDEIEHLFNNDQFVIAIASEKKSPQL